MRFEWKSSGGDAVTIQTSYSRDFTKLINNREIANSSTAEMRLESGVVFWRAFTEATKDKAVEGKLTIENISPIQGISPATATSFRYRSTPPASCRSVTHRAANCSLPEIPSRQNTKIISLREISARSMTSKKEIIGGALRRIIH